MIAVDTSALMTIVLGEPRADLCKGVLQSEPELLISATTLAEALIVAGRRNVSDEMNELLNGLGLQIVPVNAASARRAANAYSCWGKGVHPAALNLSDCFSYELATSNSCPLLFIGNDFSKTDIESAL
jgi:ribonuclease VapC